MLTVKERRDEFLKGLNPLYVPYYRGLCEILPETWGPTQGLRTFAEQAELYARGRSKLGKIVTNAPAGLSFHNYGLATDWDYFTYGQYTPLAFEDPKWLEYHAACEKLGLVTLLWDKPHNQYPAKTPIKKLYEVYEDVGIAGVIDLLKGERNG